MDLLWAPWRIDFIKGKKSKKCFLCEYIKNKDVEYLLWKGNYTMVVMNKYPYNNGHLMIAPVKHKKELNQLSEKEIIELFNAIRISTEVLSRTIKPHGFNIGANLGESAGAGLPGHLHIHIVPRWNGDTNFMPVIASTKVIPQSLEQLSIILKKEFSKIRKGKYNVYR
ncbi:MAG: HIT domain-containing protein [Candidatus Omnitrophica bacterium]|nr:HIT domain-containing protein [Candidatus Omnitrophota bacterium]MCM8828693.1 HIT domain-containing protein [Candidatus Omnitrophota bacterium]